MHPIYLVIRLPNNLKVSDAFVFAQLQWLPNLQQSYKFIRAGGLIGEAEILKINDELIALLLHLVAFSTFKFDEDFVEPLDCVVVRYCEERVQVYMLRQERDGFSLYILGEQLLLQIDLLLRRIRTLVFILLHLFHSVSAKLSLDL